MDKQHNQAAILRRTRKREHVTQFVPDENVAPANAPSWTKTGYNGILENRINRAIEDVESEDDSEDAHEENDNRSEEHEDDNEKACEDDNRSEEHGDDDNNRGNDEEHNEDDNRGEDNNKNNEDEHEVAERKGRSRSLVSEGYNSDYRSDGN